MSTDYDDLSLEDALDELVSAEDFLDYFSVSFEPSVVQVNRLHIMQRFHDYLSQSATDLEENQGNEEAIRRVYQALLSQAYHDFVESDALTEKVFKVFHMHEPQTTFVSVDNLLS